MNKITADHLARRACVYIRQSTPGQVQHNLESQRLQYALVDRARALGWQDIDVIDDDLGISGSGTHRPGFERLLRGLCDGQVGAVFSIEASRLARNGRDWHTLLEFCSVVGALLIDAEALYDPRLTNDRQGRVNERGRFSLRPQRLRIRRGNGNLRAIPGTSLDTLGSLRAAAFLSLSRLPDQAHFPSDIFIGAAIGYSISHFVVLRR
jgi:hypothetical protein